MLLVCQCRRRRFPFVEGALLQKILRRGFGLIVLQARDIQVAQANVSYLLPNGAAEGNAYYIVTLVQLRALRDPNDAFGQLQHSL